MIRRFSMFSAAVVCGMCAADTGGGSGGSNGRLSGNYSEAPNKGVLYDEIEARRKEREGKEGANQFDGVSTTTLREDMEHHLEQDDKQQSEAGGTGASTEQAGVGTPEKPKGEPIPESVKIKRDAATENGTEVTANASVRGNQSKIVLDIMQGRPVEVFLIEAKAFRPELDGGLIFVQGAVSNNILPYAQARTRFACKQDGTVIYNDRGFDDVRAGADFELVDIVKLIAHNHGNTPEESAEPLKAEDRE